ncbi:MAG: sterol desaturase family protein [Alphaproteobacteria bacterium]|nr:sterol desaturase family protein [Alphaproteobacteria bacterium]
MSAADEALLRFSIFIGVFVVLAGAEALWPRRVLSFGRVRWIANLGLSVLNTALLRLSFLVVPALTVLAAAYVEGQGWGLLPALGVSGVAAGVIGFLVLDLAIYAQHVLFHYVPVFWRLHRVHHADPDIDVSTGIRFHPIEIVVSQAWKIIVVLATGVPAAAVLAFEVALNATSMFSHSNLRVPLPVDGVLRRLIVTPDMHRVHHSTVMHETNSNFGFNLSLWDRLFGTYRAVPEGEQTTMPIGLSSFRGVEPTRLLWLLRLPFLRGPSA